MFRCCCDSARLHLAGSSWLALQPENCSLRVIAHKCGILREAFVAAAPANILRDGECWRESPFDAGGCDCFGGGRADTLHEVGVVCGAEADVVRENYRAGNVVVAVNGVD